MIRFRPPFLGISQFGFPKWETTLTVYYRLFQGVWDNATSITFVHHDLESGSVGLVWSDRPLVVNNQPSKLARWSWFFQFLHHVDHHNTKALPPPSTSPPPSTPSLLTVEVPRCVFYRCNAGHQLLMATEVAVSTIQKEMDYSWFGEYYFIFSAPLLASLPPPTRIYL